MTDFAKDILSKLFHALNDIYIIKRKGNDFIWH